MQKCFMSADTGKYWVSINPEQKRRGLFWIFCIIYQNHFPQSQEGEKSASEMGIAPQRSLCFAVGTC